MGEEAGEILHLLGKVNTKRLTEENEWHSSSPTQVQSRVHQLETFIDLASRAPFK